MIWYSFERPFSIAAIEVDFVFFLLGRHFGDFHFKTGRFLILYEILTFDSLRAMGSKKDLPGFACFRTSTCTSSTISGDENLSRFPILEFIEPVDSACL